MSLVLSYRAKITLIDKTAQIITPITINGDITGSLGTDSDFFVDLSLVSSGIKKIKNGVLKLRSIDGIFITNGPILVDSQTKSKYWIDAQIIQKDSADVDVNGELFRMQIGTPIINNTDKGLFLTIPLVAIEYRLKEALDSEQLILKTPKEAFTKRILNYFNNQGFNAPLIVIDNLSDIELPDDNILHQDWKSQGPITTHRSLVEIIERLANPGVIGGVFNDFYYFFEPDLNATKTVFIKAEEFGIRSSGVVLDVLEPAGATTENDQSIQTDNLRFKNVVIARGVNNSHRLPIEHTRFSSDIEHAKISLAWSSIVTYEIGNYVKFNTQLFKSKTSTNLNNQPDTSSGQWENLSESVRFSPWTNDKNFWFANMAGHLNPPSGYVGLFVDMNVARAIYDRVDDNNEFENITFKWVSKVGVNNPSNEATDEQFDGQRYIVGNTPSGLFSGQANKLAQLDFSELVVPTWKFSKDPVFVAEDPPQQDSVLDLDTAQIYKWSGSAWVVAWNLDNDSGISSPFHPVKSITNVIGPTGVNSAIEFEFDWDNVSDIQNQASRWSGFNLWFPFPRQANNPENIDVGDLYKQPFLDFTNLDKTPKGLSGWNNGLDSEDLGNLRGVAIKMRNSIRDNVGNLIDFIYDMPFIFWFIDKFDRIVYTEIKLSRNGEWTDIVFSAGPDAKMQLYDNRIDELFGFLGYTLPFNFFLREKEYTGVRFDWRFVKGMGCFYKDAYDENFFYKNAENDIFVNFFQHLQQIGLNLLTTFDRPIANVVIDNSKLAIDELSFLKDAYVSSRDVKESDSRQKIISVTAQSDYLNLKTVAKGIESRDAFFPQFQTLDAYGDVRLRLGLSFIAQGTRVPNSPLSMVCAEVTFKITQNNGFKMQVIGVKKFEVSS